MKLNVYIYIIIMAATTYLVRMLPLVLARKEFNNRFLKSFLYYVPYACLSAMTFPAIIYATDYLAAGLCGFIVALILSYREKSLIIVAAGACATVFIVERVIEFL